MNAIKLLRFKEYLISNFDMIGLKSRENSKNLLLFIEQILFDSEPKNISFQLKWNRYILCSLILLVHSFSNYYFFMKIWIFFLQICFLKFLLKVMNYRYHFWSFLFCTIISLSLLSLYLTMWLVECVVTLISEC